MCGGPLTTLTQATAKAGADLIRSPCDMHDVRAECEGFTTSPFYLQNRLVPSTSGWSLVHTNTSTRNASADSK